MGMHWIKQLGNARCKALMLLALLTGGALTSEPLTRSVEARVGRRSGGGLGGGGFGSFGSRGSRTFGNGQGSTRMQPLPRSQGRDPIAGVPGTSTGRIGTAGRGVPNRVANRGSWLQRNPLLGGLAGALAGTVLGSMLVNALGGMGGFGSFLMMLLLAMLLFSIFRRFTARRQLATAGYGTPAPAAPTKAQQAAYQAPYSAPAQTSDSRQNYLSESAPGFDPDVNSQTRDQGLAAIALGDSSMTRQHLTDALSTRFFQVQEAWTNGDKPALAALLTGELNQELGAELSDLERRGESNILKNIAIRRFDISEAWQEGDLEFVTAHISARLLDYTVRGSQVVAGDAQTPTDFEEFWTFVRFRGRGEWILSAINQPV